MSRCASVTARRAASRGPGIRAPRPLVTGHYLHLMAKRRPGVSDHRPRQRLDPARPHRTSQATRRRPSDLRAAAKRGRRIQPGLAGVASHRAPLRHRQHRHPPGRRPTPVAAEFGDLVLRIGRLAYHNQHWTPARAHASHIRNPADLAPAPADITCVVAAVHTAADAITRIAAEDREAVRTAAADHRLYVPAFTRTNAAVVRRRYRPASPSRVDEILASYDDAIEASTRATSKLGDLALALDAPTWPLAALRAQSQRVPRTFRPGGTSAPHRSANSPVGYRSIGARVRA